jgi:hypothetical protein
MRKKPTHEKKSFCEIKNSELTNRKSTEAREEMKAMNCVLLKAIERGL